MKNLYPVIAGLCKEYRVDLCYLFGSRADGTDYPESDIDLGVAFKDYTPQEYNLAREIFLQQEFEERLKPYEVDLLFIQRAPINLRFLIINGVILYSSDEIFRTDLEEIIVRDYLDFKPVLDAYYKEMAESILND